MNLGIFGGTFDPVHVGHMIVAGRVKEQVGLDRIMFIPAGDPWLKQDRKISEARHRFEMTRLAIDGDNRFEISSVELNRSGPTYTVRTIETLRNLYGNTTELFLILGMDALASIASWYEPRRLLKLSKIVAVERPGFENLDWASIGAIDEAAVREATVIRGPRIGISSTHVRERVSQSRSIRHLVPRAVEEYISEHKLYC